MYHGIRYKKWWNQSLGAVPCMQHLGSGSDCRHRSSVVTTTFGAICHNYHRMPLNHAELLASSINQYIRKFCQYFKHLLRADFTNMTPYLQLANLELILNRQLRYLKVKLYLNNDFCEWFSEKCQFSNREMVYYSTSWKSKRLETSCECCITSVASGVICNEFFNRLLF